MREDYEELKNSIGSIPAIPLCPTCLRKLEALRPSGFYGCSYCEVVMKSEAASWGHPDRKYLEQHWKNNDTTGKTD